MPTEVVKDSVTRLLMMPMEIRPRTTCVAVIAQMAVVANMRGEVLVLFTMSMGSC